MEILTLPLDQITPYDRNPRRNDHAVDAVAASIREFGFKVPLVIDAQGVIVTGHTRYKAAQKLGLATVPCIRADDLTPEQIRAFRLADNKVAELADWDDDLLAGELPSINDLLIGAGLTLDWDIIPQPTIEDGARTNMRSVYGEPITQRGYIYQMGAHRLMCGSSTSESDVNLLMSGQRGKILFTSPPYSDMRTYNGDKNLSITDLVRFISIYSSFVDHQCINLGIQRIDNDIYCYWDEYIRAARDSGYNLLAWNVWDKMVPGNIGQQSAFIPLRHEFVFVFGRYAYEINRTEEKKDKSIKKGVVSTGRRQQDGTMRKSTKGNQSFKTKKMESVKKIPAISSVLECVSERNNNINRLHPATMPVALPGAYIYALTQPGDIVIEPFCGSGTTIIAAEQCGRRCFGMELDPSYCDNIIARYESFTGRKAERLA